MKNKRLLSTVLVFLLVILLLVSDLNQYFSLERIQSEQVHIENFVADRPLFAAGIYFIIYVFLAAFAFPGALVITVLGGALFGFWVALALVSFASTIGATLSMLLARFILRDLIQERYRNELKGLNEGIEREGGMYLFALRLVPIIPFFLINLVMGLTKIKVTTFFLVSQIGMLAGTAVYVNAGKQLSQITNLSDVVSLEIVLAFLLVGMIPLLSKKMLELFRVKKAYSNFKKPKTFDSDLIVIGAGSGGLVSALVAATARAKVTLIEKGEMGGDCLNTGCIPSKALIRSARLASDLRRSVVFGFKPMTASFDFVELMERVNRIIGKIEPHDSAERYRSLGVDVHLGIGKLISPWEVLVNDQKISARQIIIATGAEPFVPSIPGIDKVPYLTSKTVWELKKLPERLVVLGGGPIGIELAQTFSRLSSDVTLIEESPLIMNREDSDISAFVRRALELDGVKIFTNHRAVSIQESGDSYNIVCQSEKKHETVIAFDNLILAVGRKAKVDTLGLEKLNIKMTPRGTIAVDDYLRTTLPNIYAIGDVAGPYQFTHTASHMAWYATVNALFGRFWKSKIDYSVIPWCTFSSPEVARVGLSENEAIQQGIPYDIVKFDVSSLDRAIADDEDRGLVKILTQRGSDKILGVTIVAEHAGEVISEYTLAMKEGIGLKKVMGTIHIYPTFSEMNKYAASQWRKNNTPAWVFNLLEKIHILMRW
ncbi:MAG: dihydrolipoyl dehydrogenase [Gammaproteobacteria bacterium]|nr:dihydrolipoyl dehydrogenase [Gammaproteobacteria bacterium]